MRILSVYECKISGGTDRLLIHIIKNWPEQNDQWLLCCHQSNSGNQLIAENLKTRVQLQYYGRQQLEISNKIRRWWQLIVNLGKDHFYFKRQIKIWRPDIVFLLQGGYPGAFSAQAAAWAARSVDGRIKVIMSIQNLPAMRDKKIFTKVLDFLTNKNVDQFIFASSYTVDEYLRQTKLQPSKFAIVPEGVEANLEDKIIFNDTDVVNIGIIGAYERRKGREVLFRAVKQLINRGIKNFKILSYGQKAFGEFAYHCDLATELGVADHIEWRDYEKNFDQLYGPLDIIVQPSIADESMPLVPLDAAAYYKPVVASKLQGLLDEIIHEETGYLFDVDDAPTLASYLENLILDKNQRAQLGKNARKRYLEHFTAEKMAQRYYDIFQK